MRVTSPPPPSQLPCLPCPLPLGLLEASQASLTSDPPIFAAPHLGTLQIPSVVAVAVVCARVYICICDALGSVVCFLALF